jgi:hypothetical protein
VKLADGSEHWIVIDRFTLRSGDAIARVIALEWQRGDRIPAGEIVSVRRA